VIQKISPRFDQCKVIIPEKFELHDKAVRMARDFWRYWFCTDHKNSCWEKWLDCGSKVLTQGTKLVHSLWEKFLICSTH